MKNGQRNMSKDVALNINRDKLDGRLKCSIIFDTSICLFYASNTTPFKMCNIAAYKCICVKIFNKWGEKIIK